jgi:hypothetical protein
MAFNWIDTPLNEFPKSLLKEQEYVKLKLNDKKFPSYNQIVVQLDKVNKGEGPIARYHNYSYTPDMCFMYDEYIHKACTIIYENFTNKEIIKSIGIAVNNRYGFDGLQSICFVVPLVGVILTQYRLVFAHLRDTIEGSFDGIGKWKL